MAVPQKKNLKKVVDLRKKSNTSATQKRKTPPNKPLVLTLTNPISSLFSKNTQKTSAKKVVAQPKKKMRLKDKRAYKRRALFYGTLSFAVLASVGLSLLTWHPRVAIKSVLITGNTSLSSKLLESTTLRIFSEHVGFIIAPNTILTVSLSRTENQLLAEFPKLATVRMHRAGIDAVSLAVTEKKPVFNWCGQSENTEYTLCYAADAEGYVYESVMTEPTGPKVFGGLSEGEPLRKKILDGRVAPLVMLLATFSELQLPVEKIILSEDAIDARFVTSDGSAFILLIQEDTEKTSNYLRALVGSQEFISQREGIEYVDMRVGNRIFYKLKQEAEVPTLAPEL
ncbi:MAG: hypothetical protein WAX38_01015 [Minisyncoccia bacterium]